MAGGQEIAAEMGYDWDRHRLTQSPARAFVPVVAGHRVDLHWHIWLSDGPAYRRELTVSAARELAAELLRYADLVDHGAPAADAAV